MICGRMPYCYGKRKELFNGLNGKGSQACIICGYRTNCKRIIKKLGGKI